MPQSLSVACALLSLVLVSLPYDVNTDGLLKQQAAGASSSRAELVWDLWQQLTQQEREAFLERTTATERASKQRSHQQRRLIDAPATSTPQATFQREDQNHWAWMVPQRNRQLGLSYAGDQDRLRLAVHKLLTGERLVLGFLGGSVTLGKGATPEHPGYAAQFVSALRTFFPDASIAPFNGAVDATSSAYMSICLDQHLPQDVDLVIVEYAFNDAAHPTPYMDNGHRASYERLLRKILQYPKRPAVIMLHYYNSIVNFHTTYGTPLGLFYSNAEAELQEFAYYYSIPSVSVKAALYHLMRCNTTGFRLSNCFRLNKEGSNIAPPCLDYEDSQGQWFYSDVFHPSGRSGSRAMAELLLHMVLQVAEPMAEGRSVPGDADRQRVREQELPPPVIPGNYEAKSMECVFGPELPKVVNSTSGWEFTDEGRNKWGFVGREPNASICLRFSTQSPNIQQQNQGGVRVGLAHLKSYEQMGGAIAECQHGCRCKPKFINATHLYHNSQSQIYHMDVTQSPSCKLCLRITNQWGTATRDNGARFKFKLTGLLVQLDALASKSAAHRGMVNEHFILDWHNLGSFEHQREHPQHSAQTGEGDDPPDI